MGVIYIFILEHRQITFGGNKSRNIKRQKGMEEGKKFFKRQFDSEILTIRGKKYSEKPIMGLCNRLMTKIPNSLTIKGAVLERICNAFDRIYMELLAESPFNRFSSVHRKIEYVRKYILEEIYHKIYSCYDFILLGHDHSGLTRNGDAFLVEFLEYLSEIQNIDLDDHTVFTELQLSGFSHYKRRNSVYCPESQYTYKYDSGNKNDNDISKYLAELKGSIDGDVISACKFFGVGKTLFFDDIMTATTPGNVKLFKNEPKYTKQNYKNDIQKIKKMHGLKKLPETTLQNGYRNYDLRHMGNVVIGRRMYDDIYKSAMSFLTIGVNHIKPFPGQNGSIRPLQHYLGKHMRKYDKTIAVIEVSEENGYDFKLTGGDDIVATLSWPTWNKVSGKYLKYLS
ncbi:MAG: hypothetical protein GY750_06680 [Lentisphaerae bacterium]|nr:hypothetical protein [Lentisphaerota bacterium]